MIWASGSSRKKNRFIHTHTPCPLLIFLLLLFGFEEQHRFTSKSVSIWDGCVSAVWYMPSSKCYQKSTENALVNMQSVPKEYLLSPITALLYYFSHYANVIAAKRFRFHSLALAHFHWRWLLFAGPLSIYVWARASLTRPHIIPSFWRWAKNMWNSQRVSLCISFQIFILICRKISEPLNYDNQQKGGITFYVIKCPLISGGAFLPLLTRLYAIISLFSMSSNSTIHTKHFVRLNSIDAIKSHLLDKSMAIL